MANTTWNPSDKAAGITLTGSNLIATCNGSISSVRAIDKQITGKFYWEATVNARAATTGFPCGLWRNSIAVGGNWPSTAGTVGICGVLFGGTIYVDGASSGVSLAAIIAGNVVCAAVDLDARLIWFRIGAAGLWNNSASANPATGAGGVAITLGLGLAAYPGLWLQNNADQVTTNFGDSAFTGAVPSGFTSGFTAGVTSPTNAVATQAALEEWDAPIPQGQVTQAAVEMWATTSTVTGQAYVTQAAIEMWAAVANRPQRRVQNILRR